MAKADLELSNNQREMYKPTQPLIAEEIVDILRTQPESADVLHLSVSFAWLWDFYQLGEIGDDVETLANYDYEIVLKLFGRDKCWVYLNQLYNSDKWG